MPLLQAHKQTHLSPSTESKSKNATYSLKGDKYFTLKGYKIMLLTIRYNFFLLITLLKLPKQVV